VSTAYANCDRAHIDEIVYPTPVTPDQLLATAEWMDESMFHSITPSLLRSLPNTYTFTKGLAESYLATHAKHLPLGK
jgi:fatty acyl-CoA reductase